MNKDMVEASNRQDYEHAKEIRDTIKTVENLKIKQKIDLIYKNDEEYVGFKVDKLNQRGYVLILKRSCGVISDTKQFEFDILGDNNFSSFLLQYYSSVSNIPETIYVNEIPESRNLLELTFKKLSGHIVNINKIKRSNQDNGGFDLMKLIMKNIYIRIEKKYNPVLGN
jgi:excinuclease ABC subunit C